jgi:glutathione S-transferase
MGLPNALDRTKLQSAELHRECAGCFCALFHSRISESAKHVFHERLTTRPPHVEQHLAHNEYLVGSDFSVADVYLFVVSNWARSANVDLSPYPNILRLRKRVAARPAVKATMEIEGLIPRIERRAD